MVEEKSTDGRTTFNEIKGIKVYDAEGELFGHVDDIEINKTTMIPTHLIMHKGFFGEHFRINIKYIEKIEGDRILLWISPIKNLVGTKVTDSRGTDIGCVKHATKGKDGKLEYIRVAVRTVKTKKEGREINRYIVPIMPFEDMSLSLPTAPEGSYATDVDLMTERLTISANDIKDIHKNRIVLKRRKDEYISELDDK